LQVRGNGHLQFGEKKGLKRDLKQQKLVGKKHGGSSTTKVTYRGNRFRTPGSPEGLQENTVRIESTVPFQEKN